MIGAPQIIDVTSESWVKLDEFGGGMLLGNGIGQLLFIRLNGDPATIMRIAPGMMSSIELWDMSKDPPQRVITELRRFAFKDPKTHEVVGRRIGWNGVTGKWLIQDLPKEQAR
ncbi:MAG: hypothetical protein WC565_06510 [Parcubacteria group bacterium]